MATLELLFSTFLSLRMALQLLILMRSVIIPITDITRSSCSSHVHGEAVPAPWEDDHHWQPGQQGGTILWKSGTALTYPVSSSFTLTLVIFDATSLFPERYTVESISDEKTVSNLSQTLSH